MPRYKPGVKVRVTEGSFEGRVGITQARLDHSPDAVEEGMTRVLFKGETISHLFFHDQLEKAPADAEPAESPSAADEQPLYITEEAKTFALGVDAIKLKCHVVEPTSRSLYEKSYDPDAMIDPDGDHVQQATLTMLRALYLQAEEHEAQRQAERNLS